MIKINLLGEIKTGDNSGKLYLAGYIASLLLFFVVATFLHISATDAKEEVSAEIGVLQQQLAKLEEKTKSVAEMEKKKAELNEKIKVISQLKKSKSGPVRLLDDLNLSMPEQVWINFMSESDSTLRLTGFALDDQTIAGWMNDLIKSNYFEAVDIVESKGATQQGVKLKSFVIDAKITYAGKEKILEAKTAAPKADDVKASDMGARTPQVEGNANGDASSATISSSSAAPIAEEL